MDIGGGFLPLGHFQESTIGHALEHVRLPWVLCMGDGDTWDDCRGTLGSPVVDTGWRSGIGGQADQAPWNDWASMFVCCRSHNSVSTHPQLRSPKVVFHFILMSLREVGEHLFLGEGANSSYHRVLEHQLVL